MAQAWKLRIMEKTQNSLEKILSSPGKDYKIDFGELKHFKEYKA